MQAITAQEVHAAALELATGPHPPSLLYALWVGILSPQKPLYMNCAQAQALRRYVRRGLPTADPKTLIQIIRDNGGNGWVYENHARAIIHADSLYRSGQIAHLEQQPQTMREWVRWRRAMVRIPGVSWKVASFIALIMWPFESPFVPVDSHVCRRMGAMTEYKSGHLSRKSKPGYRAYRRIERAVYWEWYDELRFAPAQAAPTIAEHHWKEWENARRLSGDWLGDGVESHALMNAREV